MKKPKKTVVIGILTIFSLLLLGMMQVQGKATRTEFFCYERLDSVTNPVAQWVEDGILHKRGEVYTFVVYTGDLLGIVTFVSNTNLDLATGKGVGWGTNAFEGTWVSDGPLKDREVVWTGKSTMKIEGFGAKITGKFISHGSAGIEGMQVKGYYEKLGLYADTLLAGEILNPHG